MLMRLKVSSLAYKFVFYKPEHNAKGGPQRIEFLKSRNAKVKSQGLSLILFNSNLWEGLFCARKL